MLTTLRATKPAITSKERVYRKIKSIDLDTFRNGLAGSELCQETHKKFNELVECYNKTLTHVHDKHAQLQRKIIHQRQRVPWYSDQVFKAAKRMRREAEKKKNGLDTVFKNYRPVSNLSFISKVTERAVFLQIDNHMKKHDLYPSLQYAYRKNHSTETALLKVTNDILMEINSQHSVLLVLLDLSAAFDTVDHCVLLRRLQTSFGISGAPLDWLKS